MWERKIASKAQNKEIIVQKQTKQKTKLIKIPQLQKELVRAHVENNSKELTFHEMSRLALL